MRPEKIKAYVAPQVHGETKADVITCAKTETRVARENADMGVVTVGAGASSTSAAMVQTHGVGGQGVALHGLVNRQPEKSKGSSCCNLASRTGCNPETESGSAEGVSCGGGVPEGHGGDGLGDVRRGDGEGEA